MWKNSLAHKPNCTVILCQGGSVLKGFGILRSNWEKIFDTASAIQNCKKCYVSQVYFDKQVSVTVSLEPLFTVSVWGKDHFRNIGKYWIMINKIDKRMLISNEERSYIGPVALLEKRRVEK